MGDIERIQPTFPALHPSQAPPRVRDERRRQEGQRQEQREDIVEITQDVEPDPVPERTLGEGPVDGQLDIAV
jgi:hypothetical protein